MDAEEIMCKRLEYFAKYPEYLTKQGKYIRENGLQGWVEDAMDKMQCSRELAIDYVYMMHRAFNGID